MMKAKKYRQFCIVIHNVREDIKPQVESYFASLCYEKFLQAIEPYPTSDGFHLHVFVKFRNARRFTSILKLLQQFSKNIVAPKPEGCETAWGRVQVDQMYGSFEQATAYLKGETKDKPVDSEVQVQDAALAKRLEQYTKAITHYHTVYYFIQYGEYLSVADFIARAESDGLKVDPYYKTLQDVVLFSEPIVSQKND